MDGDWSHFEVEEHEVQALWADRKLRIRAGDSFDRRIEYRRWSAHQRLCSPPPHHRYPLQPSSSSSPSRKTQHNHHHILNPHCDYNPLHQKLLPKGSGGMKAVHADAISANPNLVLKVIGTSKEKHQSKREQVLVGTMQKVRQNNRGDLHMKERKRNSTLISLKDQAQKKVLPNFESYIVEEEVGSGGYGTDYRARKKKDGTMVAIKFPHADAHNEQRMLELPEAVSLIGTTQGGDAGSQIFLPSMATATTSGSGGELQTIDLQAASMAQTVDVSPIDQMASSFRTLKKDLGLGFLSLIQAQLIADPKHSQVKMGSFLPLQPTLRPNALHQVQSIVNSKNKPTLPKDETTTFTHMMKFVADWFDFAEKENDHCDDLRDVVTNGGNSAQEKVMDCLEIATIEVPTIE